MQISSANSGSYSNAGLYPAVLPAGRKQDNGSASNANVAVTAATDARSLQRIAPPVVASDVSSSREASRALVLARQRAGVDVLEGIVQTGQSGNEAAAQRAVAEYSAVASQEQRRGLNDVLAGIDVYA